MNVFDCVLQWMGNGSHGLCGRAVPKPVEGGTSRGTGFVMGPFLRGSLVPERERRSDGAMKRDVQVSVCGNIAHLMCVLYNFIVF